MWWCPIVREMSTAPIQQQLPQCRPRDKISIQMLTYSLFAAKQIDFGIHRSDVRGCRDRVRTCGSTKFFPLWVSPSSKARSTSSKGLVLRRHSSNESSEGDEHFSTTLYDLCESTQIGLEILVIQFAWKLVQYANSRPTALAAIALKGKKSGHASP